MTAMNPVLLAYLARVSRALEEIDDAPFAGGLFVLDPVRVVWSCDGATDVIGQFVPNELDERGYDFVPGEPEWAMKNRREARPGDPS